MTHRDGLGDKISAMSETDAVSNDPLATNADADWAAKATTTVVGYVDTVKTATTGKALVASRMAVYFLAAGLIALVALILLLLLIVRFAVVLTGYLPFISDGEVWLAYVVLGVIFSGVGFFLWKKKGA